MSKEERLRQKQIEMQLRRDKKRLDLEVKLLLLGAGESGKSTVAKQMKMIYLNGFSDQEKKQYKEIIHSNVILNMRALCTAVRKLGISILLENEVTPSFYSSLLQFFVWPTTSRSLFPSCSLSICIYRLSFSYATFTLLFFFFLSVFLSVVAFIAFCIL